MAGYLKDVVMPTDEDVIELGCQNCPHERLFCAMHKGYLQAIHFNLSEVSQILPAHPGKLLGQAHPVPIVVAIHQLYGDIQALEGIAVA